MILLDTHVLVWAVLDSHRLGERFRAALESAWDEAAVAVSSIVFWEIALLQQKGRLEGVLPTRYLRNVLRANGLHISPVDDEIAIRAAELGDEGFHSDPADRIITATAIVGGFRLATADSVITGWAERSRGVSILDPRH